MAAARGAFARARRPRLRHVPPVALLPRGRVPVLHVRVQARAGRATGSSEYDVVKSAIQQAFVDNGAHAVAPPRGGHRARAVARAGHLGARRGDAARRCSTGTDPGAQPQPGQDRVSDLRSSTSRGRAARRRGRCARPCSSGVLRPADGRSTRGARCPAASTSTALEAPVRVRRQPLEPHGHAGDPARAAARAGAGAPRSPPRPTTSTPSGGSRRPVVAALRHRAGRARRRRPRRRLDRPLDRAVRRSAGAS